MGCTGSKVPSNHEHDELVRMTESKAVQTTMDNDAPVEAAETIEQREPREESSPRTLVEEPRDALDESKEEPAEAVKENPSETTAIRSSGAEAVTVLQTVPAPTYPTPATHLPTEVLVEIFVHLMLDGVNTMSKQWIYISHVCTRWRQIALHCPPLWTWPSFRNIPCAEAMIQRSLDLPLHIVINFSRFYKSSGLWKAFSVLSRANSLSMHGILLSNHWDFFRDAFGGKTLSAPILRSIYMNVTDHYPNRINPAKISTEFSLHAPQLRHLRLHAMGLAGSPVKLSSCPLLTSLEIKSTGYAHQDSLVNIIEQLRHLPQLEELRLFHAVQNLHTKDRPEDSSWDVHLPSIKIIEFEDSHRTCRVFFKCVTYPSHGVNVIVSCLEAIDDLRQDAAATQIRDLLATTTTRLGNSIRALRVQPIYKGHGSAKNPFSFDFWTHTDPEIDTTTTPPNLTLLAPFIPSIFQGITDTIPLQNLEQLYWSLNSKYNMPNYIWRDFGVLEKLNFIHTTHSHYGLIKALMAPWGGELEKLIPVKKCDKVEGDPSAVANATQASTSASASTSTPSSPPPPPPIFSRPPLYYHTLSTLLLSSWRFEATRHAWIEPPILPIGLRKRLEHGYGLKRIELWGVGGFTYEDVEELIEVVEEVYWDEDYYVETEDRELVGDQEYDGEAAGPGVDGMKAQGEGEGGSGSGSTPVVAAEAEGNANTNVNANASVVDGQSPVV